LQREINKLTIEKAALCGIINGLIDQIKPLAMRDHYIEKISRMKFIRPLDLCDELPYPNTKPPTTNEKH
jgi:hypothetical protein